MDAAKVWGFIGALVGGATWVAVVGGAVTAVRLAPLGVSPAEAVALMPADQRWAIGLRFVAVPLLIALVAYATLLVLRPTVTPGAPAAGAAANAAGTVPRGLKELLVLGGLSGIPVAVLSNVGPLARLGLLVLPALVAVALHFVVRITSNWWQAAFALFAGVAVTAGVMAIMYELGRDPRLDVVAVQRTGLPALTGFYISKTDDSVALVSPTLVGEKVKVSQNADAKGPVKLPSSAVHCPNNLAAERLGGHGTPCFVNELVVVPYSDVQRIVLGPRGVVVNAAGYRAAYELARLAGMRSTRSKGSGSAK